MTNPSTLKKVYVSIGNTTIMKMIPASTPIKMYMFSTCFECLGDCIGLALLSKGLAGWLAGWLSSWSGNGLEVLSGRAGPRPAGAAPRAQTALQEHCRTEASGEAATGAAT